MYAINLDNENRITFATPEWCKETDSVLVSELPTGETDKEKDITNWLYINGSYTYDPLTDAEELNEDVESQRINDAIINLPNTLSELDEAICTLYELMLGE